MTRSDFVLGVVRSRREPPGSLVRTEALGGAWIHLLPRLALGRVLVVGDREPGLVELLAERSTDLEVRDSIPDRPEADLVVIGPEAPPPPTGWTADLVARGAVVVRDERLSRLKRNMVGGDVIYAVTPSGGVVRAAWPVDSPDLGAWLGAAGLRADTVARARFAAVLGGARRVGLGTRQAEATPSSTGRSRGLTGRSRGVAGRVRRVARATALSSARAAIAAIGAVERRIEQVAALDRRLAIDGVPPGVPSWLHDLGAGAGAEVDARRVALAAPGEFPTQKILMPLAAASGPPHTLAKVGRDHSVDGRIATAAGILEEIAARRLVPDGTVPAIRFHGTVDGRYISGEAIVPGEPFERVTTRDEACPWAATVRRWITELGAASVEPAADGEVFDAISELIGRLPAGALDADDATALRAIVEPLRSLPVPTVVQHGDPGPWNLRVDQAEHRVRVLDWENGELRGVPTWDLVYFLRSFGALVAQRRGKSDRLHRGLAWIADRGLHRVTRSALGSYRDAVGIGAAAVKPLAYGAWVYQAVKETPRVPSAEPGRNIYVRTLRWLIAHRDDPQLNAALLSDGT